MKYVGIPRKAGKAEDRKQRSINPLPFSNTHPRDALAWINLCVNGNTASFPEARLLSD